MADHDMHPALATLWSHPTDTHGKYFLCCGVFVAPCRVLTVKHVFDRGRETLWVRSAGRQKAYQMHGPPLSHSSLDAALVTIAAKPEGASVATCDLAPSYCSDPSAYEIAGAFEADNWRQPLTIASFDDARARYRTQGRHPVGSSGAPVFRQGAAAVWAIATRHYTEPTADAGCVVALHQLWDGWLDRVNGVAVARTVAAATGSGPVPPSRTERVSALRREAEAMFRRKILITDPPVFDLEAGIPRSLADALREPDPARQAEQALRAVNHEAKAYADAVTGDTLKLTGSQSALVREWFLALMGRAAQLCVAPERVPGIAGHHVYLQIDAALPAGAMLALRSQPWKTWRLGDRRKGEDSVTDTQLGKYTLEGGAGQPVVVDLERLAYAQVYSPDQLAPAKLSDNDRHNLQVELIKCANTQQPWCVLVGTFDGQLSPEVSRWAADRKVSVVQLNRSDHSAVFLVGEHEVLARIDEFLGYF